MFVFSHGIHSIQVLLNSFHSLFGRRFGRIQFVSLISSRLCDLYKLDDNFVSSDIVIQPKPLCAMSQQGQGSPRLVIRMNKRKAKRIYISRASKLELLTEKLLSGSGGKCSMSL